MLPVILAEAIGSFFFASVVLATAGVETLAPLVIGLALTTAIFFTSKASAGHINPMITIAMLARGNVDVTTAGIYIVSQVIGGLLAYVWWKFTLGSKKK